MEPKPDDAAQLAQLESELKAALEKWDDTEIIGPQVAERLLDYDLGYFEELSISALVLPEMHRDSIAPLLEMELRRLMLLIFTELARRKIKTADTKFVSYSTSPGEITVIRALCRGYPLTVTCQLGDKHITLGLKLAVDADALDAES